MDYIDCELNILNETDAVYSDTYLGDVKQVGKIEDNRFVHRTVEQYRKWIRSEEPNGRNRIETLGWHLYNIAFKAQNVPGADEPRIRQAFEAAYKRFEQDKKKNPNLRLRLKLTFSKNTDKTLAQYPWEFLYMPWGDGGFFLAGEKTDLILTRFVTEAEKVSTLATQEDVLRILVIVSQPTGGGYRSVSSDVFDKIKGLESNKQIRVERLEERASPSALRRKVNEFRPHIVHFIGHGLNSKLVLLKEVETLELEKADNDALEAEGKAAGSITDAYPVDGVTLRNLLVPDEPPQEPPRLVFLHACFGAATDTIASLRSVAQELIYVKIPCVVAMQYEISNEDATLFATTFYEKVGRGRPIDEAVTAARYALGTVARFPRNSWDDPSFGTPVLYLQSDKATIFPQGGSEEGGVENAGQRPDKMPASNPSIDKVSCPYSDGCPGLNMPDVNFCSRCRRPLIPCPRCQRIIPGKGDDRFCPNCAWSPSLAATETVTGPVSGLELAGPNAAGLQNDGMQKPSSIAAPSKSDLWMTR